MIIHWLQGATEKWHAWPHGGEATLCGRINAITLRTSPARDIRKDLPAESDVCVACARKSNTPRIIGSRVGGWQGFLQRHCTRARIRVADETLLLLAARLAEVGTPEQAEAREVFEQIRVLLLTPTFVNRRSSRGKQTTTVTLPHLKETLNNLPPSPGVLAQLASTLRIWRKITKKDPSADKFRPDRVVPTMLQIPTPEAYIQHLHERGLSHLAAIFHPNTLARAQKDTALRGTFAGTSEYWEHTKDQLNIVTD